jgi:ATP-dependent exoDNAse (exonuclease V) beta subunit
VNLRDFLRPLREAGIPFVVSGGHEFLQRPEVVSTLAVLRAVAHAGDAAALLAYLRSPAGGVPDDELAAFSAEGGSWHAAQRPDGRRFPSLAKALTRLRALQEQTRALPADAAVRRVLSAAGISILHACAFEGAQRVANLRKLASTAAELGRDGRLSLVEILDAIEEERGSDPEGESPLADEGWTPCASSPCTRPRAWRGRSSSSPTWRCSGAGIARPSCPGWGWPASPAKRPSATARRDG